MEQKKILAINYSQTGQLHEIMDKLVEPMNFADVDRIHVKMKKPFDFPWKSSTFFDAMPESVQEIPAEIEPLNFKHEKYDLIIIGYQPWFLSPSIPLTSLFANKEFKRRLNGSKVITVIGARNMWLNAQKSVMDQIEKNEAELVGSIPLFDRHSNLASVVSILHWMLKGKKEKKYGIFPKPGVSDEDIRSSSDFAAPIKRAMEEDNFQDLQKDLVAMDRFKILTTIMFIEARAKKLFQIWANLIKKKEAKSAKARKKWLVVFKYYLIFALFIVSPIVLLIYSILVRPFTQKLIKKKKQYYLFSGIGYQKRI